jgi:hypothetical protein
MIWLARFFQLKGSRTMMNWLNKIFIKNAKPQHKRVVVDLRYEQQSFRLEDFNDQGPKADLSSNAVCIDVAENELVDHLDKAAHFNSK